MSSKYLPLSHSLSATLEVTVAFAAAVAAADDDEGDDNEDDEVREFDYWKDC